MKRSYLKRFATTVSLAAALAACPGVASASTDMFLKLGDIKGESTDDKHKDEIDVLAWSWGESDGTAPARRAKNGLVVPDCIQDISLTKFIDVATPNVIMDAVTGRTVPTATLTLRKPGRDQQEFLVLTLSNVSISSYSTGGSGGEDRLTENVTLHFQRMDGSYRRQKPDGSLDAPVQWVVANGSCR
ncbi:MAG: Hcp1 family type secretion system effector [Acidobacteria bacterium]|jgi:type VI secretion system secreted protein Hcp|nr:Hcp1 family type secretion system effector [Acidobacteriota bacterium]